MSYKYTHFIPQSIAPKGAKRIVVYDANGKEFCHIALGGLTPIAKTKLYSFGVVSDLHLWGTEPSWMANTKFDNALTYFENKGCALCAHCGDITQTGFYKRTVESEAGTEYLDESQFAKYKEICDKHSLPVYGICGNHESYYGMSITDNLPLLEKYTGRSELHYSIPQGNDLFIFIGQPLGNKPMSDDALNWLATTLEDNRDKRCFIFVHPHISSGNPLGAYSSNPIFDWWEQNTGQTSAFKDLLNHHKNTIIFHGHSHTKFECQEVDDAANYTEKDGFKSVHVPSLSRPRNVVNGVLGDYDNVGSYGYLVDVYADCVVLNGIDFITNKPVPLGTFKIDTTLQTIEANTFTDSTGTITV